LLQNRNTCVTASRLDDAAGSESTGAEGPNTAKEIPRLLHLTTKIWTKISKIRPKTQLDIDKYHENHRIDPRVFTVGKVENLRLSRAKGSAGGGWIQNILAEIGTGGNPAAGAIQHKDFTPRRSLLKRRDGLPSH
jgi:hypothetical protein